MKTSVQKPATSKLLKRYDNELKTLLMADLESFKQKNQFAGNNQVAGKKAA
ncbi:hypothetical protein [Mucilaginibacter antarcticus]|uniref:Histone H1-like protein Hc1 n=1 Tax=Mucilaginibacter antarcticus TaxID=1855725 RepID=A0ABW5XST6_9SPHI